jgi:hypothetical protein
MNDTVINKVQSIERCIKRAREEYRLAGGIFARIFPGRTPRSSM